MSPPCHFLQRFYFIKLCEKLTSEVNSILKAPIETSFQQKATTSKKNSKEKMS